MTPKKFTVYSRRTSDDELLCSVCLNPQDNGGEGFTLAFEGTTLRISSYCYGTHSAIMECTNITPEDVIKACQLIIEKRNEST